MEREIRVVITGASGFIGSHLCDYLQNQNVDIITPVRESTNIEAVKRLEAFTKVILIEDDISKSINSEVLNGVDFVIHLASYAPAEHSEKDLDLLLNSNIRLGLHLAEAANKVGAKFLNIGTNWQHFEGAEYSPVSLYAATKQAMQDLLLFYSQVQNLSVVQLDLSDTYGVNDFRNKLIPKLIQASKSSEEVQLTDGTQLIDLVNVEDIVKAIWKIMNSWDLHSKLGKFSVTSKSLITVEDLVDNFERTFECRLNKNWGSVTGNPRKMYKSMAFHQLPIDWEPEITLEEGLKKIALSVKQADNLND